MAGRIISAVYTPCKDLFLYLKGERQDILAFDDRLRALIVYLITIISRKGKIDEALRNSVSKKKSIEYGVMETELAGIFKKYTKFTTKYAKITKNLPIPTIELDADMAKAMIEQLDEKKPKIFSAKFFKLADLSRDIAKLSERASKFLDRLNQENLLDYDPRLHEQKLTGDSNNDLPVFDKYVDHVISEYLLSKNENRVGVTGPAGVGKTTVLRKLHDRLMDTKLYSNIIWIPEQRTIEKIQTEIMLQLQIDHEKTPSEHINATKISTFLQENKYIFIMDHVSENIDLNEVGIKEGHKYGNVVIASSDKKAISLMIKDEVEIRRLVQDEALTLFEMIHGKIDERFKSIADRIIECLGGLPREIKFVAKSLKNKKHESSWNDVKRNLQSHIVSTQLMTTSGIHYFYEKRYNDLKEPCQKCFLFTALFPFEYIIYKDYLIECWMAERFIEEDDVQKLRRSRDSGQAIVDQLTDMYLLDWCEDRKYVKMPSICRRMLLQLVYAGQDKSSIWVPSDYIKPKEETWKEVTRMSLISCTSSLPQSPQCSNIHTLLLRSKPELKNLADAFFFYMKDLRVLDLYHTEIGELPHSIDKLINLKSLCLNGCKCLQRFPSQASKLKKLEFLDICGTAIASLPKEIECMVGLRCLRASFSSRGKEEEDVEVIPLGIIHHLKNLEELSINAGNYIPSELLAEALAKELASLEYLTTLQFAFPNVSTFNTFVTRSISLENERTSWGSHTFRSFKIFVGCEDPQHSYESDFSKLLDERRLRFCGELCSANTKFLQQTCAFELLGDQKVSTLSRHNLSSVKVCAVGRCSRLKNIVDGYGIKPIEGILEQSSTGVFQDLEKLHLYDLNLLECVWKRSNSPQRLDNLTVLTLMGCPKLTRLLDPEICRALPSLKTLKIESCGQISQIVACPKECNSTQVDLSDILSSVKTIELINLPNLESICYNSATLNWNSLNSIYVKECKKLRNLSLSEIDAPSRLVSITCEKSWWDQLPLGHGMKQHLSPLCIFLEYSEEESSNRIDPSTAHGGEGNAQLRASSSRYNPIAHHSTMTNHHDLRG